MSTKRSKRQSTSQIFPSEILLLIGIYLEQDDYRKTLSSLARSSRTAWETLTPLLYSSITIPRPNALFGVMDNFGHQRMRNSPPPVDLLIGKPRGLRLLRMMQTLTLEAVPTVVKINNYKLPDSSDWHELKVLTNYHSVLVAQKRLKRFTITGSAIHQLQFADPAAEMAASGYDLVTMPSDGLPPEPNDPEFAFLPQSGFPIASMIAFFQPIHLVVQYPLTWYQHPRPEVDPPNRPPPLGHYRPHEVVLKNALEDLNGKETTVCVHDLHDQIPPVGSVGAQHHISFVAFPSVPIDWSPPMSVLPYVSISIRLSQIKGIINESNPYIPNVKQCTQPLRRAINPSYWEDSNAGTWTFYRVGAMISHVVPWAEFVHGDGIERQVRAWVKKVYAVDKGHPEGFADDINARIRFIHGDGDVAYQPEENPDNLVCEGCGHKCRVPVD